ncbi:MAG: IPT/TIG domain-containing protein [bacterium]|nr:IPT/TIG domain-containing protein [bacterium]
MPGAREYLFEVRDAKKAAVLRRTVKRPKILVKLPEGSYEMRSRAVDRFRRRTPWSDWAPLRIRYAIPPSIVSVTPEEYDPESGAEESPAVRVIELRGKNFMKQSEVQVFIGPKAIPVSAVNFVSADTLRFELPADAPAGQYDLLVVNPGDVRARMAAAFRVKRGGAPDGTLPNRAEPGPNAETARETLPRDISDPGFSGLSLIPGLPDFRNGRYIRGTLWAGAFLGASIVAVNGFQTAASASAGALSNPLYPSFSNPVYLFGLLNFGTGTNAGLYAFNTTQIFNDVQSQYNAGRTQYTTFGGAALLVYFTHLALHSFAGPDLPEYEGANAAAPGVSVWVAPAESLQSAADRNLGVRPQMEPDIRFAWSLSF